MEQEKNKIIKTLPLFDTACTSPQDKNKWTIMSTLVSVQVHFGQPNTGLDGLKNRGTASPWTLDVDAQKTKMCRLGRWLIKARRLCHQINEDIPWGWLAGGVVTLEVLYINLR